MSDEIILALVFGGVGAMLTYYGVAAIIHMRRFAAGANTTRGIVVAYESEIDESQDSQGFHEKTTYYFPIVGFRDAEGIQRRVKTSTGSNPKRYSKGAPVAVLYSRDGRAEIKSFGELWLLPMVASGAGAIFLLVAVAVWVLNIPVGTPFTLADIRFPAFGRAAPPPATTKPPVEPVPIVITKAEPDPARIGEPITLRGSNFSRPVGHRSVSIGGHGINVYLRVIEWKDDAVTVEIPDDPRILQDRAYYYRIDGRGPYAGSNLFGFVFESKK